MVESTKPGWLKTAFDTLTGIFDWVGMKTNVKNTVGMVCHPCRAAGLRSDKAYTRRVTGVGRSYKERQWERLNCLECGKDLERGSLAAHRQTQHGIVKGVPVQEGDGEDRGGDPREYRMESPAKAGPRSYPVYRCSSRPAATRTATRMHFWYQHFRDTVVIL